MVLGGIPRFVKGLKRMEVVLGSGEAGMKNGSGLGVDWGNNVSSMVDVVADTGKKKIRIKKKG